MSESVESCVLVEQDGAVLRIGPNRPEKRHAADRALLRELAAAYTRLEQDDSLRVGLLPAEGDHFTGGFDLTEALRIGLVRQVVPAGTERSAATAVAEPIAAQAPLVVQATLRSTRAARRAIEQPVIDALPTALAAPAATDDAAEGLRAFRDRRDPVFTGR